MAVAKTILEQLGGGKFMVITGASNFLGDANSLSFRLPGGGGFCKDGINHVKIELTGMDDYIVTFNRIRAGKVTEVAKLDGVYNDMLMDIFENHTGLYCTLAPRR